MIRVLTDALSGLIVRASFEAEYRYQYQIVDYNYYIIHHLHFQQDIQEKISQYLEKKVKGIYDRKPMPNRIVKEKLVLSFEERKKRAQEKYASLKAQGIDTTEIDIWG